MPLSEPQSPKDEDQSKSHPLQNKYVQLQEEQEDLQRQEACLHAWNSLQGDIHQLHQLYVDFNKLVDVNCLVYTNYYYCGDICDFLLMSLGSKGTSEYSRR